jgi:hypothetical protein
MASLEEKNREIKFGKITPNKPYFYFLFTIVMKVLISCTENSNIFIEVLDELEVFIDKKVIFDEKKISVGPPPPYAVCVQILESA